MMRIPVCQEQGTNPHGIALQLHGVDFSPAFNEMHVFCWLSVKKSRLAQNEQQREVYEDSG